MTWCRLCEESHCVHQEEARRDPVAERGGKAIDEDKVKGSRVDMSSAPVDIEAIAAHMHGPRMSKPMRDAIRDERRWRLDHPTPPRPEKKPAGYSQSWRRDLYDVVVTEAFCKGTDELRSRLLAEAGSPYRLSAGLTGWAKNELTARLRREVMAED